MTSISTTAIDGTQIKIEGAGPELDVLGGPSTGTEAPSNIQIDTMISDVRADLEAEKANLDPHGKNIVTSTQGVLDATSTLLKEKNKGERFQRLYLFTKSPIERGPSEGLTEAVQNLMSQATGIGSKISDTATDVFTYIRETIFNLTTSSEYRELAIEFLNLLQSMMGQLKSVMEERDDTHTLGEKLKTKIFDTDDDQMDDISEKLGTLLRHVSQQEHYQRVVKNFMKYSEQIYDVLYRAKQDSSRTKEAEDVRRSLDEAWEILNDFAGRDKRLVPRFRKHLIGVLEKVSADEELRSWFHESQNLLIELMENPENVEKCKEKTNKMIHRGRDLSNKYREDLEELYVDAQRIVERIQSDPVVKNFQRQLKQLGRDLALNARGQPDLFVIERSMTTIKDIVVERFKKKVLVDIPIRRVEVRSNEMDILLTNITVEGTGFVPELLHVKMASYSDFHLQKSPEAQTKFLLRLRVEQMKPHFKGVQFAYEKKTFPSIKDHGVADVLFDGTGLNADVAMTFIIEAGNISRAVLTTCTVSLDKIALKIDIAKHDILDAILAPIIQARLRTRIESGVHDFIQSKLNQIVDQLNDWFATRPFDQMLMKGNETLRDVVDEIERKKRETEEAELREIERRREERRVHERETRESGQERDVSGQERDVSSQSERSERESGRESASEEGKRGVGEMEKTGVEKEAFVEQEKVKEQPSS